MSAPLHSDIGLATKSPTRSRCSAYPQNTRTSGGWLTKCGWCARTTDINQRESLKVTRPPLPALLPVNASILSKNMLSLSVTAKDSQQDSGMLLLKAAGLPNSGRPSANFSQSDQPPLSCFVSCSGGRVIEPKLDASVMEAFWKKN